MSPWAPRLPDEGDEDGASVPPSSSGCGATASLRDAVDFEVGGVVGVRLLDPTECDVAAARRVLGEPSTPIGRVPDLTVRFTPKLRAPELTWVEPEAAGFSDQGLFVFRVGRKPARTRVSFDADGGAWELLCESGRACFPLLLPLVRVAALRRSAVPLHAAAFVVNGRGVIASGWPHGGKTSALLAFMERGARYAADDWVLLSADGARLNGMPGAVTLSDAQARSSFVRTHGGGAADVLRSAAGWAGRTLPRSLPEGTRAGTLGKAADRVGRALVRRAERRFEPEHLFGERIRDAEPHVLFLMTRHQAPDVRVEPLDPGQAATRLACAAGREELPLLSLCHAYHFAFPASQGVRFLYEAAALRERILRGAVGRLRAFVVRHPPGVHTEALHSAMAPLIEAAA